MRCRVVRVLPRRLTMNRDVDLTVDKQARITDIQDLLIDR
jgi:hypothetical protein